MAAWYDELNRRATDAFNRRDLEGFLALCDSEIELHSRFAAAEGVYRGHNELQQWHQDIIDAWEFLQLETEDTHEVDEESAVVLIKYHGKGRVSGVEVREEAAYVITYRDLKIRRLVTHPDRAEALASVGL